MKEGEGVEGGRGMEGGGEGRDRSESINKRAKGDGGVCTNRHNFEGFTTMVDKEDHEKQTPETNSLISSLKDRKLNSWSRLVCKERLGMFLCDSN